MQRSEHIFWGVVAVAGVYLVIATSFNLGSKANAQLAQPQAPQVAANAAAPAQGMGCMAKGGGCGCGGMMKKVQ